MKLGVCYYPEHWPSQRWKTDAEMMRQAGISIVRIAEFAWTKMEPVDGQYDWAWLDEAVETLVSAGHKIVLCTPTAAPPAWMVEAHPEILPVDEQGRRLRFGSRRHYCPTNKVFLDYTRRIVQAMAERYGDHPDVIGWQIDNEFACYLSRCYCDSCEEAFRGWLRENYSSLDELNQHWGNEFWSQTYNKWTQIEPPNLTVAEPNPAHVLDHYRFTSDAWVVYQQAQIDTLRGIIKPDQFITHNIIACHTTVDYHDLSRDLDFISWDSYPTGYQETESENLYAGDDLIPEYAHDLGDPVLTGFFHSLARGLKQAPYWIMEQQTGAINWSRYNTGVRKGALRLWTWQAAASGAEAVVSFRWRASRFGLEQHHAGLLKHDGTPDNGFADLQQVTGESTGLENFLAQPLNVPIGILLDYSTLWALEMQPHRQDFACLKHLFVYYRACKSLGIEVDIISPRADLSKYKILLAPSLFLMDTELRDTLSGYVSQGGNLLMGVRSGVKDINNVFTDQPLPGLLRGLTGAAVHEWHALPPRVEYALESDKILLDQPASFWAEALRPDLQTETLVSYTDGPFSGLAALTRKTQGQGQVLTCGIYPKFEQAQAIMRFIAKERSIPVTEISAGLFDVKRGANRLLMNFTDQPLTISIDNKNHQVAPRDLLIME